MQEQPKDTYPFFPVGLGCIGMGIAFFIAIAYAPNTITQICEFFGGAVLVVLGIFAARQKGE
ncbi:MAG: hypothetical protein V1709_02835 [Planctomycetota bacterium]